MSTRSVVVIGCFLLAAFALHAGLSAVWPRGAARPLHVGHVQGDIVYRINASTTGVHKANGCRVECYEAFVLVYVDKSKEPTWTDNYVLSIPWRQIESMTLGPARY